MSVPGPQGTRGVRGSRTLEPACATVEPMNLFAELLPGINVRCARPGRNAWDRTGHFSQVCVHLSGHDGPCKFEWVAT